MYRRENPMKIAAVQMCSSENIDHNLAMTDKFILEAAKNGAKLIVLPEMFAIMGLKTTDKIIKKETFKNGKIQSFLSETAKKYQTWIVGGTIPIACDNKTKIRAACIVFNNKGEIVARYDKIHLFDVVLSETETYKESDTTELGDKIIVIDTPLGKLGLTVCYDIRFPELFRCLANKGAEIVAIPSAFTVKTGEAHWQLLAQSRAVENFCYVIGSCQGGTHTNGRKTHGHSLIIEPWGNIIAKKDDTEPGVIYANIDLDHLKQVRKSIPALDHQKISISDKILT
jgi:nitrilase